MGKPGLGKAALQPGWRAAPWPPGEAASLSSAGKTGGETVGDSGGNPRWVKKKSPDENFMLETYTFCSYKPKSRQRNGSGMKRKTIVAYGRTSQSQLTLEAARDRAHGLQAMTFEQLATRLAGGLLKAVDAETLSGAIQEALPDARLGELDRIKELPGFVHAARDTLSKVWRAGIDLETKAGEDPRIKSVAELERAVLERLPAGVKTPRDLAWLAQSRVQHARRILGEVRIIGITELSPVWRKLLGLLAGQVQVVWDAGPRFVPDWLPKGIEVVTSDPESPGIRAVSAATPLHEALEACRWARRLLSEEGVAASDIAIATVNPSEYADYMFAARAEADFDLHMADGVNETTTREGQTVSALADLLLRGLSRSRLLRFKRSLSDRNGRAERKTDLVERLGRGWERFIPQDAPLSTPESWDRLLAGLEVNESAREFPQFLPALREMVDLLQRGPEAAEEIGDKLLAGQPLSIWRRALRLGPAQALGSTMREVAKLDCHELCSNVAWMPVDDLASAPRKHVWLLGLNSSRWPRRLQEDSILPDHIVPSEELVPLGPGLADRRDFETALKTARNEVVLSFARNSMAGRILGKSVLLSPYGEPGKLRRNAAPGHAFSEPDRILARPKEFAASQGAIIAKTCWSDWESWELTPHDGVIRGDHPVIKEILKRVESATSLSRLLRDPIGYVWQYGLKLRPPPDAIEPLTMDSLAMGEIVHKALELALKDIEGAEGPGLESVLEGLRRDGEISREEARDSGIGAAIDRAVEAVSEEWTRAKAIPPKIIWEKSLEDVRSFCLYALTRDNPGGPGLRLYAEVPFGGEGGERPIRDPWDSTLPVAIEGTGISIKGAIDRLDISGDGKEAFVLDYKTGRLPRQGHKIKIRGGKELQRCLYAFAAKSLLEGVERVEASLLYLRDEQELQLENPDETLERLTGFLATARRSLESGKAVIGPDSGEEFNNLRFALPANSILNYCDRMLQVVEERMGPVAEAWEED